jgi:rhamnose utilization protein RhaD (predicted bifunctional aldolase and dehydrogenase)
MNARWDDAEVREFCSQHADLEPGVALRRYSARLLAAQSDLGAPGMFRASFKPTRDSLLLLGCEGELDPDLEPDAVFHAAVPAPVVDQIYPSALLALACQPDAELRVRALFGARVGWVAWNPSVDVMARDAADLCEKHPELEAIVLQGRGLLSFGADARESFERALRIADRAEALVQERMSGGRILDARPVVAMREAGEVAHVLRGALAAATGDLDRPFVHVLLDFRSSDEIAHFASAPITPLLAAAPPPTEAHARLLGCSALFVASPPYADLGKLREALRREVEAFRRAWSAGFERAAASRPDAPEVGPLAPTPRVVLLPGLGLFGVGATRDQARAAAAAAEHAIRVKIRSVALGQYTGMAEDAALLAASDARSGDELSGRAALVAGAGPAGAAVVRALARSGAEVLLVDGDPERLEECVRGLPGLERLVGRFDDPLDVRDALRAATERFGGIDLLVLDADALAAAAEDAIEQTLALLAAQGTGGGIALVASADVTELCRRAGSEAAGANVRVEAIAPDAAAQVGRILAGRGS